MRFAAIFLLMIAWRYGAPVGLAQQSPRGPQEPGASAPSAAPETEVITAPTSYPPAPPPLQNEPGFKQPAEISALLHNLWLTMFRISDLLNEAHPERWKLGAAAGDSFHTRLESLSAGLGTIEEWRSQFERRPDSVYLGFETNEAVGAVLGRLDTVAQAIAEHENSSLAAQYAEAENQLADLHQAFDAYLGYLLRNQDQFLLGSQNNLASCQKELGYAMHASVRPATPMANQRPARPQRWGKAVARATTRTAHASTKKPKTKVGTAKQPEAKPAAPAKPAAVAPVKPGPEAKKQ